MKCYAAPKKDAWEYSPKFTGAVYRSPARQHLKRRLHKSARKHIREELRKLLQEEELT